MSIQTQIEALQTDKTNIRNAILNKGGTSASGNGFDDFATDIATIPSGITPTGSVSITENGTYDVTDKAQAVVNVSGGGGTTSLADAHSIHYMFGKVNSSGQWAGTWTYPETVVLPQMPNCIYAERAFAGNKGTKEITFGGFSHNGVNMEEMFRGSMVKKITLLEDIYPLNINYWDFSLGVSGEEDSGFFGNGRINMSLCTSAGQTMNMDEVRRIAFVENTIKISFGSNYFGKSLNDESVISVANGLNETVQSKVLTFHTNAKNKLSTILGTVALDTTGTFHIFTQDASGTTTLQDFITNTKGWTIA